MYQLVFRKVANRVLIIAWYRTILSTAACGATLIFPSRELSREGAALRISPAVYRSRTIPPLISNSSVAIAHYAKATSRTLLLASTP
jgi:hypothetical protein